MALRPKSLCEDSVDTYTHVWAVLFFLFLAFLTLVVPTTTTTTTTKRTLNNMSPGHAPEPKVTCWCPSQFEASQVDYTHAVCTQFYKNVIKKSQQRPESIPGYVWDSHTYGKRPEPWVDAENNNREVEVEEKEEEEENGESGQAPLLQAPTLLFVLALGLRLPHILWSILSCCTNSINVGQTLVSLEEAEAMEDDRRRQRHANIIQGFLGSGRLNKHTSTYLYLFLKVAMIVVVVAELMAVSQHTFPEPKTTTTQTQTQIRNDTTSSKPLSSENSEESSSTIFPCSFRIRQYRTVHDYIVQCLLERNSENNDVIFTLQEMTDFFLSNVYHISLASLVVLLVANILNTVGCFLNLCGQSSRAQLGLDRSTPLDLVLLIHKARASLGAGVGERLAEMAAVNSKGGQCGEEGEELFKK